MIILTKVTVVNNPTEVPSTRVESEDLIGVDPLSVITVEKYMYNGGSEGSMVYVDGRGYIIVAELMTDIIHAVEREIKEND